MKFLGAIQNNNSSFPLKLNAKNIHMNKKEFLNLIEDIVELDRNSLSGEEKLAELEGWDSLSVVAFIAATDKHLGSPPPPASIVAAETVADLVRTVEDRLSND
ncbi:acyl carrier protein [Prosthecobacter sp. SYSU 5D2]|uniref:acyl carrier protein n=1 Tax=Prosthecobacter sp. SYSU 5D2 TaxID=3134134 RepID=UPI0031FF195C